MFQLYEQDMESGFLDTMEILDLDLLTWSKGESLPQRIAMATAHVLKERLIVIGGHTGELNLKLAHNFYCSTENPLVTLNFLISTIYEFDLNHGWTTKAVTLRNSRFFHASLLLPKGVFRC